MSDNIEHGLIGYSQDPAGYSGKSEDQAAQEEYDSIKPGAEERAADAKRNSDDVSNAAYGPNQRSEAFRKGQNVTKEVGRENFSCQVVRDKSNHTRLGGEE